jgi:MFS family permease
MSIVDLIFYAVFISQIFLISVYYPKKTYDRNMYVVRKHPASEYPKLYPPSIYADPEMPLRKTIRIYFGFNIAIALFGLALLFSMAVGGYAPSHIKEEQDLIFIVFFFLLQIAPHYFLAFSTGKWYANIRSSARTGKRTAQLSSRNLFDFVSPVYFFIAVIAFIGWMVYYVYNKGFTTSWEWNSYVAIATMMGVNFLLLIFGYVSLRGKKADPYLSSQDQNRLIRTTIRVLVFASIMMSVLMVVSSVINRNGWDIIEPVMMSLYFQTVIIFGIGEHLRKLKVEDVNFDVYKKDNQIV